MMKYTIIVALFCLIGLTTGTMWINQGPLYTQVGSQFTQPYFAPMNLSPFEIINAPYFPLLGEDFYASPAPVQDKSEGQVVQITSTGSANPEPYHLTFSGSMEDNFRYASGKSSVKVGQGGSWVAPTSPCIVK